MSEYSPEYEMNKLISMANIRELKPNPKNPNKHTSEQINRLAQILEYQGWRHPIVVSERSGYIAAGHGRLEAAKQLGWTEVPVSYQNFESDEQEYAFLVSDNSIASWAELDLASINLNVPSLGPDFDIDLLGIKDFVLEPAEKFNGDPDEVPDVPKEAKTKLGELWMLGEHRLLVGDCTVKENVERLMNGEKADMVFTDPPYGVDYDPEWRNDHLSKIGKRTDTTSINYMSNDEEFDFTQAIALFDPIVAYVWHANRHTCAIHDGLLKKGIEPKQMIIWNKTAFTLSRSHYHWKHEACWYAIKTGENHMWAGANDQNTVWDYPPMHSYSNKEEHTGHACQKPVALMEHGIKNHTCKIVADPFLGSGSTLIACHKTNRRCFGMEIDPLYGDVILTRFAKFSGIDPVREDGVKWSELTSVVS